MCVYLSVCVSYTLIEAAAVEQLVALLTHSVPRQRGRGGETGRHAGGGGGVVGGGIESGEDEYDLMESLC